MKPIRSLADDRNIVIKKADKGSCIVIWDRNDYLAEAENQLSDKDVYQQVSFKEINLIDLLEIGNRFFRGLKLEGHISEKKMKYFMYEYKKVTNLGKLYLLITTWILGKKYSIKFLEPLLAQNLHHYMRAFSWISLRQIFSKRRNCSHLFGLGI